MTITQRISPPRPIPIIIPHGRLACVQSRRMGAPPRYLRFSQHQAPQVAARSLRRDDVDDRVPEALQGESQGLHVAKAEDEVVRVGEGIDPVGGGGDPGEEEREEVEEGDARVQPGVRVGLVEGGVAGQFSKAEHLRPARAPLRLARVHVGGVGRDVVVGERGEGPGFGVDGAVSGVVDGFGGGAGGADDGDLGGDDAGEGVLV